MMTDKSLPITCNNVNFQWQRDQCENEIKNNIVDYDSHIFIFNVYQNKFLKISPSLVCLMAVMVEGQAVQASLLEALFWVD